MNLSLPQDMNSLVPRDSCVFSRNLNLPGMSGGNVQMFTVHRLQCSAEMCYHVHFILPSTDELISVVFVIAANVKSWHSCYCNRGSEYRA